MGISYTTEGKALINNLIDLTVTATVTGWYLSWGTGTATDSTSSTELHAEATEARVTTTGETQSAADTFQWAGLMTAGTDRIISEVGLHTAATDGDMVFHGSHDAVTLATGDQILYTLTFQQT